MRQPPENAEHGIDCFSMSKPNPFRIDDARPSADHASISASRVWISAILCPSVALSDSFSSAARSVSHANTVSRSETSLPGTSCAMPPIRAPFGTVIDPVSRDNSPRITRNSVVFPVPFRPTSPTLCPVGIVAVAFSTKVRPATE